MNATTPVAQRSRWPLWTKVVAVLFLLGLPFAVWPASLAVLAALFAARKRWPRVGWRHYFTSQKCALPIIAGVGGMAAWLATYAASESLLATILLSGVACAALSLIIRIFEGKLMKSIFDLIPIEQQQQLNEFVAGDAPVGQHADFTQLDQQRVIDAVKERVIGQDAAVEGSIVTAFRRARLARHNKPVATLLYVGATGAGKTELAKALASEMFENRLVRIDCNELSGDGSAQRLIGAPPGYIGSDQGSQVCREIGRLGTGVILFDEIEKAHPVVLKTIMSLLDEARITEQSTSTTYSATGFLIVLTSNAAQSEIAAIAANTADPTERARKVKDELKGAGFLPEILARIDAVYPFAPLDRHAQTEIVGRFLQRFAADAGITLTAVDAPLLIDLVTKAEQMKGYGVREVVRAVEGAVVDGLLDVKDRGATTAAIHVRDGRVAVEAADARATQAAH